MQVQWSKLFSRALIWLCAEISLTCLGLDDLADYEAACLGYSITANLFEIA